MPSYPFEMLARLTPFGKPNRLLQTQPLPTQGRTLGKSTHVIVRSHQKGLSLCPSRSTVSEKKGGRESSDKKLPCATEMESAKDAIAGLRAVPLTSGVLGGILLLPVLVIFYRSVSTASSEPWSLPSWKGIPFVGNTIQYIVDNASFIDRAR
jgi:hypothetical protein